MNRLAIFSLLVCLATGVFSEEVPEDRLVSECVRAIDAAKSNAVWRWVWRGKIEPVDAAFQQELREELRARYPEPYRTALLCSGETTDPQMAGLRSVFAAAVQSLPSLRRISNYAVGKGFVAEVQLDVADLVLVTAADGTRMPRARIRLYGRSANVTDVLRDSLKRIRQLGHKATITPDSLPVSWYECWQDGRPMFSSHCQDVRGFFKYGCSYRMSPKSECPWQAKERNIGVVRTFADVDCESVWQLLARSPSAYTFEDVLKTLGKPRQSIKLSCSRCKARDMRWAYDIRDADDFGDPLRHLLVFSFAADGRCTGWYWEAV